MDENFLVQIINNYLENGRNFFSPNYESFIQKMEFFKLPYLKY